MIGFIVTVIVISFLVAFMIKDSNRIIGDYYSNGERTYVVYDKSSLYYGEKYTLKNIKTNQTIEFVQLKHLNDYLERKIK